MNNFLKILTEIKEISSKIDSQEITKVISSIVESRHIFITGAGRSGLMIKAFANRLLHLGFNVSVIGEITTPHTKEGDLLIIASNSGETVTLLNQAEIARENNLNVVAITGNNNSTLARISNFVLHIPLSQNIDKISMQPMGSLFEQTTLLLCDSMVLSLMEKKQEKETSMLRRHANIE